LDVAQREELDVLAALPEINLIRDTSLRDKVIRIWQRMWKESSWRNINDVPVSRAINYPHIRHNRAVVRLVLAMADVVEELHGVKVNRDLLLAAALLQDASKLVEYRPGNDGTVERTEIGGQLGHSTYSAHAALDEDLPIELVHAILSHSPDSSLMWNCLEAKLLYLADQADIAALKGDRFQKKVFLFR
jgi:hypothetical protein